MRDRSNLSDRETRNAERETGLKIVFLAPFGIRPKGTVLARMIPIACELQALGHTVIIVAPPYTNPEDSGKVETVRGVRLINVVLPGGGKVAGTLTLAWRMLKVAQAERPDLVHLFKPKGYGGIAAMLLILARKVGVRVPPVLVDTDDWEGKGGMNDLHSYSGAERAVFAFQERWLLPHALGVTIASRGLEEMSASTGVASSRIFYLPNCVEELPRGNGTEVRRRLGIPADAPVLLLYTRFFEFDQEKLHHVLAGVYRQVPSVHFLVVGKGRKGEEALLDAAARRLGFSPALHVAGWVEPVELGDYLAAGDVAIYPFDDTLVNRCKCPAKLTELMRAGVPVVADRVGQLCEYIPDRQGGILCDTRKPDEMVAGTVALLTDLPRAAALGEEGRTYLLDRFNWRRHVEGLHHFYLRSIQ
jgi:glycosyltransferase involved in cell wall biosynthesis